MGTEARDPTPPPPPPPATPPPNRADRAFRPPQALAALQAEPPPFLILILILILIPILILILAALQAEPEAADELVRLATSARSRLEVAQALVRLKYGTHHGGGRASV